MYLALLHVNWWFSWILVVKLDGWNEVADEHGIKRVMFGVKIGLDDVIWWGWDDFSAYQNEIKVKYMLEEWVVTMSLRD